MTLPKSPIPWFLDGSWPPKRHDDQWLAQGSRERYTPPHHMLGAAKKVSNFPLNPRKTGSERFARPPKTLATAGTTANFKPHLEIASMEVDRVLVVSLGRRAAPRGWDYQSLFDMFAGLSTEPLDVVPFFARASRHGESWDSWGHKPRVACWERGSESICEELASQLEPSFWTAVKPLLNNNVIICSCNWGKHRSVFSAHAVAICQQRRGSQQIMFFKCYIGEGSRDLSSRLPKLFLLPCKAPNNRLLRVGGRFWGLACFAHLAEPQKSLIMFFGDARRFYGLEGCSNQPTANPGWAGR